MNRKNGKSNNKRMRGRKPRINKTLFGGTARKAIQCYDTVNTVNGFPDIVFASSTGSYSALSRLVNTAEFDDIASVYQAFRIIEYQIEVTKIISPNVINTVIPAGLPTLYFVMYPFTSAVNLTNDTIISNDSALLVSPQEVRVERKNLRPPRVLCWVEKDELLYTINPGGWLACNQITQNVFPGQLSIGARTLGNASSATALYEIRLTAIMVFAYPY